jgi:hypothetical protein
VKSNVIVIPQQVTVKIISQAKTKVLVMPVRPVTLRRAA